MGFFDEAGIAAFAEWGGKGRLLTGVNYGAVCSGKGDSARAANVGTGARRGARSTLHSRIGTLHVSFTHSRIATLHVASTHCHVARSATHGARCISGRR